MNIVDHPFQPVAFAGQSRDVLFQCNELGVQGGALSFGIRQSLGNLVLLRLNRFLFR